MHRIIGVCLLGIVLSALPVRAVRGLLLFRYDAARKVAVVTTRAVSGLTSPQAYARALAQQPEAKIGQRRPPTCTIAKNRLTVTMTAPQKVVSPNWSVMYPLRLAQECWLWTPGVSGVTWRLNPNHLHDMAVVTRTPHLAVAHPATGEVAFTFAYLPRDLREMLRLLNTRSIDGLAQAAGFAPILPDGITLPETLKPVKGTVTVALPRALSASAQAGLVLALTSCPSVTAVRVMVAGTAKGVFTPYDLSLTAPKMPPPPVLPNEARFTEGDAWPGMLASPRGSYLVVPYPRQPGGAGTWRCTVATGAWERIFPKPGAPEWSADERVLVLAVDDEPSDEDTTTTFYLIPPTGKPEVLGKGDSFDWQVLPDGSGLVIVTLANWQRREGARDTVQYQTQLYRFADKTWKTLFTDERVELGMSSIRLNLRRHQEHWVMTYQLYTRNKWCLRWIDLDTGTTALSEDDDQFFISPDGHVAIASAIFTAKSWPTPYNLQPPIDNGALHVLDASICYTLGGNFIGWAPTSRRFAYQDYEAKDILAPGRYCVANEKGQWQATWSLFDWPKLINGTFGAVDGREAWVGGDHLRVEYRLGNAHAFYLRPVAGGPDRPVCVVNERPLK
jgi:hypothetical protein